MGMFRATIIAVGNHGCQRELKSGELVAGCGQPTCTDCITREYVAKLKASGASIQEATVHHWPGSEHEVLDNLQSTVRVGSF